MFERRRFPRTKVLRNVKIVFAGPSTLSCVVYNLTNYGASVHLPNAAYLPRTFGLSFDAGYTLRNCRVVWWSNANIGVSFE